MPNRWTYDSKRHWMSLLVIASTLWATNAIACQVPVFRYALERWETANYTVSVQTSKGAKRDTFSGVTSETDASNLIEQIRLLSKSDPTSGTKTISNEPNNTTNLNLLLKEHSESKDSQSRILLHYPARNAQVGGRVAASLPLSSAGVQQVANSPARQRIVEGLLRGEAIVWVLLKSGDKRQDDRAEKEVVEEIKRAKAEVELPTAEELDVKEELLKQVNVPWTIDFSIVAIDRDDAKEKLLIESLLSSEDDLREFDEPILFPVFGRGIVLYALVGEGIESSLLREAIAFVMGPCSCQVKEQNPGFDLLLDVDWEKHLGDKLISQPAPEVNIAPRVLKIPPGANRN